MLKKLVKTVFIFLKMYSMILGDVQMIYSIRPLMVAILAWFFLKEALGILEAVLIIISAAGILLVMQPPFIFSNNSCITIFNNIYNNI